MHLGSYSGGKMGKPMKSTRPTQFRLSESERDTLLRMGDGDLTKGLKTLLEENILKYLYKDNVYIMLKEVYLKHPTTRKWVEAIEYTDITHSKTFVREKTDFFKKFRKID